MVDLRRGGDGHPERARGQAVVEEAVKLRRRDADHFERVSVHFHRAADDILGAGEHALPDPVADDDDRGRFWTVVRWLQQSSARRSHAEYREILAADDLAE